MEENKSETRNPKSEIQYDDFAKLDLKVATVMLAKKLKKPINC